VFRLREYVSINLTQVVDASVALDSARRSMYDPDELDEEQRERHLRKKLNEMSQPPLPCDLCCNICLIMNRFKEFCKKMERVAKQHHYDLEYDAERIATFCI
jgi:hypothetical protein